MNIYIIKILTLLLLLGFLLPTTMAISASIPCFEGINCSDVDNKKLLGSFYSIIKNNTFSNSEKNTPIAKATLELNNEQQTINYNDEQQTINYNDEQQTINSNNEEKHLTINLKDFVALSLQKQTLSSILKQILPHWYINVDNSLKGIMLDIIIQTTRKKAIIDISRAVSAKANFYLYTKPLPTLTLLKI